nr:EOG090X0AGU [Lepidurus arcticus]
MWTAMCIRFLRSKLVLTTIFLASLTYCLFSLMSQGWILSPLEQDPSEMSSGRRPLGHTFVWHSGPQDNNLTEALVTSCRNSVQGKVLIADDRGYVCNRQDLQSNGCCRTEADHTRRYPCDTCRDNGCCAIYEYCIACCLHPDKKGMLEGVMGKAAGSLTVLLASVSDHFELCLTKCRTSSQSVQHENSYRNSRAKHCYGEAPPPLETEATPE